MNPKSWRSLEICHTISTAIGHQAKVMIVRYPHGIEDVALGADRIMISIKDRRLVLGGLSSAVMSHLVWQDKLPPDSRSGEYNKLLRRVSEKAVETDKGEYRQIPTQISHIVLRSRFVTAIARPFAPATDEKVMYGMVLVLMVCIVFGGIVPSSPSGIIDSLFQDGPSSAVVTMLILVSCILLHELGHAACCFRVTRLVGAIRLGYSRRCIVISTDISPIATVGKREKVAALLAGICFQVVAASLILAIGPPLLHAGATLGLYAVILSVLPIPGSDVRRALEAIAGR